jgi:hypothetical protein
MSRLPLGRLLFTGVSILKSMAGEQGEGTLHRKYMTASTSTSGRINPPHQPQPTETRRQMHISVAQTLQDFQERRAQREVEKQTNRSVVIGGRRASSRIACITFSLALREIVRDL